jgi:hypothetical protein
MWVWLMCGALVAACEGPAARILLDPLPPRHDAAADEDAGPELPPGAKPCRRDSECDDGIDCTLDSCATQGYCNNSIDNSRCSDNVVCNGTETCDGTLGCIQAPIPNCDDHDPCTIDSCDESVKDCVHAPRDFDRDGEADFHCPGGTDCDDFDATRGTRVLETCHDGIDNDCDDQVDETDCGALPHDTCADALDISAGGTFEVGLVGAVSDYFTSCGHADTDHDVVFSFEIATTRDVKLVARGLLAQGDEESASLSLERSCGASDTEVECARGFPGDLRVRALPAGRYYVIASSNFAVRSLLLSATFGPATAGPSNATCDNAVEIGDGGHFEGDFVDVGDDIMSRCTIEKQPDVFYAFTLTEERDVEISALGSEASPVSISVRKGCNLEDDVLRCETGVRVLTRLHGLPKGSYILVLEGPSTREIGFMLDVAVTEPTPTPIGDSCSEPHPIALGETQRLTLEKLQDDVDSSCQKFGPDAVLALNVPVAQDLEITLDGDTSLCSIALQTTCGDLTSERMCRVGMPVNTRLHGVAAGDYFVVIDSPTASGLTLKVDSLPLTPTVPVTGNDNCYTATEIPEVGGLFAGDTRLLLADYDASCGGGALSKDAAFSLMLPVRKHVVAVLDADFDSVLLRFGPERAGTSFCSEPEPAACVDDTGVGGNSTLDEMLDPGTYFYIVDGYKDLNAGQYTFDVSVVDP